MIKTDKAMLATVVLGLLVAGCGPAGGQASRGNPDSLDNLPRITQRGTDYPYIRYSESTGQTASRGQAIFLYPIRAAKTEILALEYSPGMKIEDLFGEELLGRSGNVVNEQGHIRIDFLPISMPIDIKAGRQWPMQYAKRNFVCSSRAADGIAATEQLSVSCRSPQYTLNFTFDRSRGITEFQDFCDFEICTFKLMDPQGVLSSGMMQYIGLPSATMR